MSAVAPSDAPPCGFSEAPVQSARAYRTTLPRLAASAPVDTGAMAVDRRISAAFKDLPGGQVLGPTFDYMHRLLDFMLAAEGKVPPAATAPRT